MAVEDVFPEDPTQPRFEEHVGDQRELTIAWKKQAIALGKGLQLSSKSDQIPNLANAFRGTGGRPVAVFNKDTYQSYREVSTSSTAQSSEHTSFSLGVSVDVCGGLLGASVHGSYDKQVNSNSDDEKVSLHSSFRFGTVTFASQPQLTYDAYGAVPTRFDHMYGVNKFTRVYGDYYVGGLVLGADNVVMVSSYEKTTETKEKLSLSIKVKVLCWSKTKTITKTKTEEEYTASMSLTAFDTLEGIVVAPPPKPVLPIPGTVAWLNAMVKWAAETASQRFDTDRFQELVMMGKNVEQRAWDVFNTFGLQDGSPVSDDICARLCESGLVVGIILVPFSKCVDYVAASYRSL